MILATQREVSSTGQLAALTANDVHRQSLRGTFLEAVEVIACCQTRQVRIVTSEGGEGKLLQTVSAYTSAGKKEQIRSNSSMPLPEIELDT